LTTAFEQQKGLEADTGIVWFTPSMFLELCAKLIFVKKSPALCTSQYCGVQMPNCCEYRHAFELSERGAMFCLGAGDDTAYFIAKCGCF